jgi:hypothetical protein
VPLKEDLRRMVAEHTRDLRDVAWDVGDGDLLPDAPAWRCPPDCQPFGATEGAETAGVQGGRRGCRRRAKSGLGI